MRRILRKKQGVRYNLSLTGIYINQNGLSMLQLQTFRLNDQRPGCREALEFQLAEESRRKVSQL